MLQDISLYKSVNLNLAVYGILMETLDNTALQKFFLKYTIDEYDHFLCFLAAESVSDIRFPPSRLDFAAHEITISRKQ